jgi:hypothetical protein
LTNFIVEVSFFLKIPLIKKKKNHYTLPPKKDFPQRIEENSSIEGIYRSLHKEEENE